MVNLKYSMLFKRTIEWLTAYYDRKAEKRIIKAMKLYHSGSRFNQLRGVLLYLRNRRRYDCNIYPQVLAGEHLHIAHANGITVGKTAILGDYCRLYPGVCIISDVSSTYAGPSVYRNNRRHAKIGNNCLLGCSCKVIGPIEIGNNVIIGAGAIVTKDVPDNMAVVGVNRFILRSERKVILKEGSYESS